MELIDKLKLELILNKWLLKIRVIPNAKSTKIDWIMDNWFIKIRIVSVPEKWKANKQLIDFLSNFFGIKKSQVEIISWLTDRNKIVRIDV